MKKIIENLQALLDSIEFAETEYKANYVIETNDKKLVTEALNEALRIDNVMQAEVSDVSKGAAVASSSSSDWRNDEYNDIDDDFYDDETEHNTEAENCHCGAYKLTKTGWLHVSDCCC